MVTRDIQVNIEKAIGEQVETIFQQARYYILLEALLREAFAVHHIYIAVRSDDQFGVYVDDQLKRFTFMGDAFLYALNEYKKRVVETSDIEPINLEFDTP